MKIVLKEQNDNPKGLSSFIDSLKRMTKAFKDESVEFNKQFSGDLIM